MISTNESWQKNIQSSKGELGLGDGWERNSLDEAAINKECEGDKNFTDLVYSSVLLIFK